MNHQTNKTWVGTRLIAVLALALTGCVVAPVEPYGYAYNEEVYLAPSPRPVYRSYAPAPMYGRTYAPAPAYRWVDDDRRSERNRIDHRHDRDRGHWTSPPNRGKPERDRQRERDHDRAKERERDRDRDRAADRDRSNQTQARLEQQRRGEEIARTMRERFGPAEHETINVPRRQPGVRDSADRAGWDRIDGERRDGRKFPRDR